MTAAPAPTPRPMRRRGQASGSGGAISQQRRSAKACPCSPHRPTRLPANPTVLFAGSGSDGAGPMRDLAALRPGRRDGVGGISRMGGLQGIDTSSPLGSRRHASGAWPCRSPVHARPVRNGRFARCIRYPRQGMPLPSGSAPSRRRRATASAKLSATRRPRANMSGSVV